MALFRKFFLRKQPSGLVEISERVYVFDSCFSADAMSDYSFRYYVGGIVSQIEDSFPDASIMACNFQDDRWEDQISQSLLADILSSYGVTVTDYPGQYQGCPVLTMETIHHFLRSAECWLTVEGQHNLLLLHCERGGWAVLAFMLAALLLYQKQYNGEQRTLEMLYKKAPRELLQSLSPLNPMPSQKPAYRFRWAETAVGRSLQKLSGEFFWAYAVLAYLLK